MMEGEDEESGDDRAFNKKGVWARISVVAAGPVFNFIMAVVFSVVVAFSVVVSSSEVVSSAVVSSSVVSSSESSVVVARTFVEYFSSAVGTSFCLYRKQTQSLLKLRLLLQPCLREAHS